MFRQFLLTTSKLLEYRRNQRLSRAEFERAKLEKFRRLARHAIAKSPYYADIARERKIDLERCTPQDFPPLTKSALLSNFDRIATDSRITHKSVADFLSRSSDPAELMFGEFTVIHTSGSSGEVGYFVFSHDDWFRGLAQRIRTKPSTPFRKMRVMFYGAAGGHFAGVSMASVGKRGLNRLIVRVELCEINTPMPDVLRQMNDYRPDLLVGYATALKILARKQQEGALRIAPIRIEAGGEAMTENDRDTIAGAFKCEVHNVYASSEHLMMGVSRPGTRHMTMLDDDLIYECHDNHVLTTNLFNFTLPLIRYRMSDILRPVPHDGSAPPYLVIENLVGRSEMAPTFVNREGVEDFLSPHTINEIFVPGVLRFQMRLKTMTFFRFLACVDTALGAAPRAEAIRGIEARLREILAQKQMDNVTFEVETVDDLPLNPKTRKFNLIVDERSGLGAAAKP
jgi:phenylacetate-coenzyme A ligase PaaK-like adenylate-forming protein